jgi:hypothetical protein
MHPSSIFLLATLRHEELDRLNAQERLVRQIPAIHYIQPGALAKTRVWACSLLIAIGTRIRGTSSAIERADAGRLSPAGTS